MVIDIGGVQVDHTLTFNKTQQVCLLLVILLAIQLRLTILSVLSLTMIPDYHSDNAPIDIRNIIVGRFWTEATMTIPIVGIFCDTSNNRSNDRSVYSPLTTDRIIITSVRQNLYTTLLLVVILQ